MSLSDEAYYQALAIAPKISGSLSIIGSSFIIRDVYNLHWKRKHNRRRGNVRGGCNNVNNNNNNHTSVSQRHFQYEHLPTTSRVMLSLSISDIGSSFWAHFMSTWLVPKDDEMAALAAGNQDTCTSQSFFYEIFIHAGLWSSVFLAIAYWLTICREKSEKTLRQWKWQTFLLGLPWIFGLINSLPKLILGSASYNGFWWCELVDGTRADNLLDQISIGVGFLLVVFSMVALARFVYAQEKKMDRFSYRSSPLDEVQQCNREKTIQVTYQGLFYIMAWIVILLPSILITAIDDLPRGYILFWSCLFPLQGLANALIYFRPKYRAIVRRERNTGGRRSSIILSATVQVLDVRVPEPVRRLKDSVMASFRGNSNDGNGGDVEVEQAKHIDEEAGEQANDDWKENNNDQIPNT